MSEKLIEVYHKAQNDFLDKKYIDALAGFTTVLQVCPDHLWSRFQVGKTLEAMRKINRAFEVYEFLASHCIKAGFPFLGFVAAKRAERVQTGLDDILQNMAELYNLESDRVDNNLTPQPLPELQPDIEVATKIAVDDKLAATAEQTAKLIPELRYPKQLPPLPLFSFLALEAFFPVLDIMEMKSFQPGQVIIQEGEPAKSFFLLAYGEVELYQENPQPTKTLARLSHGSVFGEMSLITDAPRTASAKALTETEILELMPEDIEAAAEDFYDINPALAKFTRQRFLNNLFTTSPVFAPFSSKEKTELFDRVTSIGVPSGDIIVREGNLGAGLYLILAGEAEINNPGGKSLTLKEGSVFGENFLVHDTPSTATITATRGGEFLFLPKEDFQELAREQPHIQETLKGLSKENLQYRQPASNQPENQTNQDNRVLI